MDEKKVNELIGYIFQTVEIQNCAHLIWFCRLNAKFFGDSYYLRGLLWSAFGQNTLFQVKDGLQSESGMTSHQKRSGANVKLVFARCTQRKFKIAHLIFSGFYTKCEVIRRRCDSAQNFHKNLI